MALLRSLTQAIGLLAVLAPATAYPQSYRDDVILQEMLSQPMTLRQGWPWEASAEEFTNFEDFGDFEDMPSKTMARRQTACTSDMPKGAGPTVSPDTAAAFLSNTVFQSTSFNLGVTNDTYVVITLNNSAAIQPTVYDPAPIGYLGWMNMPSYVPYNCAQLCTGMTANGTYVTNGTLCHSYNIYYLRSPTVAPSNDTSCPNPSSMTNIVCAFYANNTNYWNQANVNQTRGQFQVVVAGKFMTCDFDSYLPWRRRRRRTSTDTLIPRLQLLQQEVSVVATRRTACHLGGGSQ